MKNIGSILRVKNLVTSFSTETGTVRAVDNVSFSVPKGKTLGIVGESGCGKSVTAFSILRLLPKPSGVVEGGSVFLGDTDLIGLTAEEMRHIRGKKISMIFQEPMTALNPVHKIGRQLSEMFHIHFPDMASKEIKDKSVALFQRVSIPDPEKRLEDYPHQISGGMRQRVMIAMAIACEPEVLIADEPTTALDVTIQAQILDTLKLLQRETEMTIVFITHDLGVIAEICDNVLVMYAGRVAESAPVERLFKNPEHPYTKGLLNSIPRLEAYPKTPLNVIHGMVPDLGSLPRGCRFNNRCPEVMEICKENTPPIFITEENHKVSCYKYGN
jgi:oligopeptide/dipeptide ABC transporter ATP-binding protein